MNRDAFNQAVNELKSRLDNDKSKVVFVAAVENSICDEPQVLLTNKWIGIIHSTISYPDSFYVPDLERLCSGRFDRMLDNCLGLFTLTDVQRLYLLDHLKIKIPIQTIFYPIVTQVKGKKSKVVELLESGHECDLVFIGEYARDFDFFFSARIPDQFNKVILSDNNSQGKCVFTESIIIMILVI